MGTLQDLVVSVLRSPFVVGFASVLLLLNSPGLNSSLLNIGVSQLERLTHNGRVQNGDQALYPFIRFLSPFLGALATTYGKTSDAGGRRENCLLELQRTHLFPMRLLLPQFHFAPHETALGP